MMYNVICVLEKNKAIGQFQFSTAGTGKGCH
jgi:hypothetical protein